MSLKRTLKSVKRVMHLILRIKCNIIYYRSSCNITQVWTLFTLQNMICGNYSISFPVCAVYQVVKSEVGRVTIKAFPGVPMFGSDVHPQRFFVWTSFTTVATTYNTLVNGAATNILLHWSWREHRLVSIDQQWISSFTQLWDIERFVMLFTAKIFNFTTLDLRRLIFLMGSANVCLQTTLWFWRKITFFTLELFTDLVRLWHRCAGGFLSSMLQHEPAGRQSFFLNQTLLEGKQGL